MSVSRQKIFTGLFLEKCLRFIRIFNSLNPLYITKAEPKSSKYLLLNADLFIFQLMVYSSMTVESRKVNVFMAFL
ncbi:hypothetical protein DAB18_39365 [Bradyrhizobium sp. WBAH41]|nr:hypothetical protein DAB18_39365 [Bradyrhizobium sp. WBAH41]